MSERVRLMGIVNATPDSFSDGGRYLDPERAIARGLALLADGADIVDVGGESTRPGAARVDPAIERERALPVVAGLAAHVRVSIDTMNARTAAEAVAAGASLVNDVSGGLADPELLAAVADTGADVVLGHWRGHASDMYAAAHYDDVVDEVRAELDARAEAARAAGIPDERIVLDPGLGFAKRGEQNWEALRGLHRIAVPGGPRVLVGASRKGFLRAALGGEGVDAARLDAAPVNTARLDAATAVVTILAAQAGAWGVRVHDVAASADALRILELAAPAEAVRP